MITRRWKMGGTLALCLGLMAGCEPEQDAAFGDEGPLPQEPPMDEPPMAGDIQGDVILRNRVALDMPVSIQPLADEVELDCDAVEQDPAAMLTDEMFAEGEVHTLSPHEMMPVWPHEPGERPCYAVRVETEGLGVRLLFWRDGDPPITWYRNSCCDVGQGVVELMPVDGGWALELLGNEWLVYAREEG